MRMHGWMGKVHSHFAGKRQTELRSADYERNEPTATKDGGRKEEN